MAEWSRGWPAPAKLNLFLHITARRADGYHELQSLFQFVDYADELDFLPRKDGVIRHLDPLPGVDPEQDLIVRAARLLQSETGGTVGCDITLRKRLPMGGGLGGGSSDAATTLVALNRLWCCALGVDALAALGLRLGADVPVFVRGVAAWAEGVGERLTPVNPPEPWYLVLVPDVHIATVSVFSHPGLTRNCKPIKIADFLQGRGYNVCENVVRELHAPVAAALDWLSRRGEARMTGTGACCFAPFAGREQAEAVYRQLPEGWRGFVARGANRSPLLERLAQERQCH